MEGHAINGTTFASLGATEAAYDFGPADLAGGDISQPYKTGLIAGNRTLKGREYQIALTILGKETNGTYSRPRYLYNVQAITALVLNLDASGNPQPFTLTRTLTLPSGDQVCTINARYSDGMRVSQASWSAGRAVPKFILLDPWWVDGVGTKVYA